MVALTICGFSLRSFVVVVTKECQRRAAAAEIYARHPDQRTSEPLSMRVGGHRQQQPEAK